MNTTEPPPTASDRSELLIQAGLTLAAELDLDAVLQRIADLAVEITDARYGAIGVLGEDRRIARFITSGISEEDRRAIGDYPTGHGILGAMIAEAGTLRVEDIAADPRSVGVPPHHPKMHSFLGAPVRALGRIYGNIYLTEKRGGTTFTLDDERALEVLATQAGVAIENARLYEEMTHAQQELRRLEVLEERERIAKELHDGVIQALFAVGMSLQGAAAMATDPDLQTRVENAVEDIDRSIRDLRNYIFGLRPGILADRQLDQALHELCVEFEDKSGVVTVADIDTEVAAELASVASDVVQLVREALSNIGRHAAAATCRVTLRRAPSGGALLEVDDDGTGFDVDRAAGGMGLGNLRDRVESLGGELRLVSAPSEGTTVTALLPL
ncbi:MAG: GAF domain-containing protein [Planctomycetaceae bacterium]